MHLLKSRLILIICEIFYFVAQIINGFIGDIIVNEITNGFKFNWSLLLTNRTFWLFFILQVVHFIIVFTTKKAEAKVDDSITEAINKSEIELLCIITQRTREGDFKSAHKTIKIFDKIEKKRR